MIAEGRITIDLHRDGEVRLQSNRTADVGKLMTGRTPDEVLDLLPLIFSLCGQAHFAAARQAMAAGTAEQTRQDALLVLAENAREHLLRIMMGWQQADTVSPIPAPVVMSLVSRMQAAAGDRTAEAYQADHLADLLQDHVLGISPQQFLQLTTLAELQDWVAQSPAITAQKLADILRQGWQTLGAVPTHFLPDLPQGKLTARLAEPTYLSSPDWLGQPRETGPLARQHKMPLVDAILAEHGAGLLARLVARLVELVGIPDQMRQAGAAPTADGLGVVETARGRLIHAVRLDDGKIAEYHILAPTEWNFHPEGAAVQALKTLHPVADRAIHARALIEAIDPCVDFEVRAA